ncbi:MAG: patatin-like phospholipase family protein [Roseimicrobium sp.]
MPWPLDDPARDHSEQEVLDAERRWHSQKRGRDLAPGGTDSVGLALSGGGIRSATFNLGVLQSLAKLKVDDGTSTRKTLLERIDYLSTVSGGGYIGAWLIANWKEGKAGNALNDARNESPQVLHLRRYSRYLAPEDGMLNADTWTMASIWLRNTILVQAMVACWVFTLLLFVRLLVAMFDVLAGWPRSSSAQLSSWMDEASEIVAKGFSGWLPISLSVLFLLGGWTYMGMQLRRVARAAPGVSSRRKLLLKSIVLMFVSVCCPAFIFGFSGWLPLILTAATLLVGWAFMGVELRRVANVESGALEQEDVLLWIVMPMFISACGLAIAFAQNVALPWIPKPSETMEGEFLVRKVSFDSLTVFAGRWEIVLVFALAGYLLALTGVARKASQYDQPKRVTIFLSVVTGLVAGLVAWALTGWWVEMGIFFGLFGVASFFLGKKQSPRRWGLALLTGLASGVMVWLFINILVRMMWGALSLSGYHLEIARLYLGPVILLGGISLVVAIIGLLGRSLSDPVREWVSRLGAWLGITLVVWVVVKSLALHGPLLVDYILGMESPSWIKWPSIFGWLAATVGGVLAGKSSKTNGAKSSEDRPAWGRELFAWVAPWVALVGLLLLAAWLVNGMVHLSVDAEKHDAAVPGNAFTNVAIYWLVGFVVLGFVLVHRIDLNEFSMNQFYRNRLVRCYLGAARVGGSKGARKPHPFAGFDFDDDFALADLAKPQSTYDGPYPILCGSLNTSSGGGLDTQERKAESFIFTPIACGSSRERAERHPGSALHAFRSSAFFADGGIGQPVWNSSSIQVADKKIKPLTLGTCVSISGAAVSPNWGYHTSPVTAFFLTLFNARLGWWLPNPASRPAKSQLPLSRIFWKDTHPWRATHPRTSLGWLSCLKDELFGGASPVSSFVNITDGGHFENLGIYELVRRRCHFIICSDGEEDGGLEFNGLGTAIRRCRIDFGVEIVIDVSQISSVDAQGRSKAACAIGRIKYPESPNGGKKGEGILVYLKLSVTGSESADLNQYRAQHQQFPHESTGDQFFTESQFESYRKLGLTVGRDAFKLCWKASKDQASPPAPDENLNRRMESFGEVLADYWAVPARSQSDSSSRHTESLMRLWQRQARPESLLKFMDTDLLSNFTPFASDFDAHKAGGNGNHPPGAQVVREAAYTCQEMLQLMENVFVDLQLEDESAHPDYNGWMNLFRHWADMPALRLAWKHTKQDYGKRFQIFCRHKLELEK